MSRSSTCSDDTELLKLRLNVRNKLAAVLDIADSWQDLAEKLPKDATSDCSEVLYSAEDIMNFQIKSRKTGSPTLILLEDWSRRGQPRPKIKDLLKYLLLIEHFRAANIIAVDVLNGSPIESKPLNFNSYQNANTSQNNLSLSNTNIPINSFISTELSQTSLLTQPTRAIRDNQKEEVLRSNPDVSELRSADNASVEIINIEQLAISAAAAGCPSLVNFTYHTLRQITDNFNSYPYIQGGRLLGEGAFGSVFYGYLINIGQVAVKCLKGDASIIKQFQNEVQVLSQVQHENILHLFGYSFTEQVSCLVYEFMPGGSLLDKLACKFGADPLNWLQRLRIAVETARGILYLHTSATKPLVHRDIKSANILLDNNLHSKIGDFGLVRQGAKGSGAASTVVKTMTVFGTSVYMPPEAFRGDISTKMDVFAYGIVLLEILTGLPPQDSNRDEEDLLTFMSDNCEDLSEFIDEKLTDVDFEKSQILHEISKKCTNLIKNCRPTMQEVMPDLENFLNEEKG
ncbi:Interleukin-1 receptor-associated kinase 4 [Nymphon striatum]|nr:Interleukin-1 receptor-associated kinase 4 [Nymphon striatum]